MKIEESKQFIRWCILGAIGGILMAAGDWYDGDKILVLEKLRNQMQI